MNAFRQALHVSPSTTYRKHRRLDMFSRAPRTEELRDEDAEELEEDDNEDEEDEDAELRNEET